MPLTHHDDFKWKRDRFTGRDAQDSFRRMTGPQMMYLSLGLESMEDPRLRQIGRSLRTLHISSVDGGMTSDEALDSALANLNELPKLLRENGGANLRALHQVMEKHPEYGKELPENLRDKSFLGHMRDVTNFLELDCEKSIKKYEDQLAAEEEERRRKEEEQKLKDEQNQKALKERRAYRQAHGAFAMPSGCDAYDAAGLFVQSAQQGGSEYRALQNFCKELGDRLDEWENYADNKTAERNREFEKQYPADAPSELRQELIGKIMNSVSAEDKEEHLDRWYPDGLEKAIAQKRRELDPSGKNPVPGDRLLREIYGDAMATQYKNVLREKTYGQDRVWNEMQQAGKELAQDKIKALTEGTAEERESLRKQREQCRNDIIARRFKTQMIEAYRAKQADILLSYCPTDETKNRYKRLARSNNPTDEQLYEALMTDLLDKCLDKQEDWDGMQQHFVGKFGAPAGQKGQKPLDDMLAQIMDGEDLDEQVELELQQRVARQLPHEEIDRRTDQRLGFRPPEKEALLYEWARDTQKLRMHNDALKQRDLEFTDITQNNLSAMTRLHNNLRTILNACKPGENAPSAEKLADRLNQAAGPLKEARKVLRNMPPKDGKLREAYDALDQAWTEADFAPGKALREQSGIQPGAPVEERDYGGKVPNPVRIVESSSSINIPLERRGSLKPQAPKKYCFTDASRKQWALQQEMKRKKLEDEQAEQDELDASRLTIVDNDALEEDVDPDKQKQAQLYGELLKVLEEKYPDFKQRNQKALNLCDRYLALEERRNSNWQALQDDPKMPPETRDDRLARFLTADTQMRQMLHDGKEYPSDDKSFGDASSKLGNSLAFSLLKDDLRSVPIKSPDEMARAFRQKQRVAEAREREVDEKRAQLAGRMKPVRAALEQTRRGTVLFFPRAGLLGNSRAYTDALEAISRAEKGVQDAKTLYEDTQTVMRYLNGKEKVRARAFGRERWTQCMTYLKNVLPREEFKAYCDEVNQKRGVDGNPRHKNFVTPQSFGPTRFQEAQAELLEDVKTARRPEDCAALLALRGMDPDQKLDRRRLAEQTQTIMANGTFQWLMKNPKEFTDYVNKWKRGDVDFITKYQDRAEKDAKEAGKPGMDAKKEGKPEKKLEKHGPSIR